MKITDKFIEDYNSCFLPSSPPRNVLAVVESAGWFQDCRNVEVERNYEKQEWIVSGIPGGISSLPTLPSLPSYLEDLGEGAEEATGPDLSIYEAAKREIADMMKGRK